MDDKIVFEQTDRGYTIRAWYQSDSQDARVEITKNGQRLRHFTFPAYKVWNLAAHFSDIVDSELTNTSDGYAEAASDGLGGFAPIRPIPEAAKEDR